MRADDIDPQLPYIQVHRGVAAKAAQLAARCNADYYRVRGVLDCFWESLADRRILARAIQGIGYVVVTPEVVESMLCRPLGCSLSDLIAAGFIEPMPPHGYRARGMSRYLDSERTRLARKPNRKFPPTQPEPHQDETGSGDGDTSNPTPTPLEPHSDPTEVRGERREVRGKSRKTRGEKDLAAPVQVDLPGVPPKPPPPPRDPTPASIVWDWYVEQRELQLSELGVTYAPPAEPNWGFIAGTVAHWSRLPEVVAWGPGGDVSFAKRMVSTYLELPYWAGATDKKTGAPEPYPWNALASEKVWRPLAAEILGEGERRTAP